RRTAVPTIALAGYTNAGKSTLLNALTDADVSVEDRLFETLDPTTRGFEHEGRRYLVTDTVGFIRRLPHQLVEGFAATLEETLVADLVLHVVDGSASDEALDEMAAAVDAVLAEIGAGGRGRGRAGARAAAAARAAPLRALPRRRSAHRAGFLLRVIELPIRRLRPDAVLPRRAYPGDAGLDLAACERVVLGPGERAVVATGLAVAIPDGYAGFVQPRSGLAARSGISFVN